VKSTLNVDGNLIDLSQAKVMGILNVTPDSFYKGSRVQGEYEILSTAEKMLKSGADFIDIGGYSTRPGATDISPEEEKSRVCQAISQIKKEFSEAIISIDTFRSSVARTAISSGASLINDVSGGTLDPHMFQLVGELKTAYVLMHMRGTPQNMKSKAIYNNLITEIYQELQGQIKKLQKLGVSDIIIDPGFGFAKTLEHNYALLKNLEYFKQLELPLLVGLSRKSMVYKKLDITADESLNGTTALHMAALINGASILRVHDVKEAKQCIQLYNEMYL
jgi:dihydropteroate synthase